MKRGATSSGNDGKVSHLHRTALPPEEIRALSVEFIPEAKHRDRSTTYLILRTPLRSRNRPFQGAHIDLNVAAAASVAH